MDRMKTLTRWKSCQNLSNEKDMLEHMAQRCMTYKANYYDPVTAATGIPWYMVAVIDMREENFNHNGYLGNGDSLWRPTVHVPRGRGPFKTWYEGAIDALVKVDHVTPAFGQGNHWDIVTVLIACEKFNGGGYAARGLPSPYVWAGTSVQVHGKFTSDGHFNPSAWDTQPGCAGVLLALKQNHGVDLNEA